MGSIIAPGQVPADYTLYGIQIRCIVYKTEIITFILVPYEYDGVFTYSLLITWNTLAR